MKYYSTKSKEIMVSVKEALFKGLPADNGLYMPASIPILPSKLIKDFKGMSPGEIGFHCLKPYFSPDIPVTDLESITHDAFNFPLELNEVAPDIFSLELYHGPTMAFKDFGARFLARSLNHFSGKSVEKVTVLVATSGDTGSAVAAGFYGMENIEVIILYPKGRISDLQERQMTTLGKNITAIRVDGSFDDCQKLVKQAFLDKDLGKQRTLTSANSINIARFLPQMVYYYWAISRLVGQKKLAVSIPSGNYGNMTAGVIATLSGLGIDQFIASSNLNDTFPRYLQNGNYEPRESISTVSNAMDVGDPSNFRRMEEIFHIYPTLKEAFWGQAFSDPQTLDAITEVYQKYGYTMDPHGAVGWLGLNSFLKQQAKYRGLFLETAHPIKFRNHVENSLNQTLEDPIQIKELGSEIRYIDMNNQFDELKSILFR